MADGTGKPYYWESMNINTTGENVGVVLDSLCDIVAENEAKEGENTVKWIPGEEGEKGHFELGEGGGKVVIPGMENQLVAANGKGEAKSSAGVLLSTGESGYNTSVSTLSTPYPAFELKNTGGAEESYWNNSHKGSLIMKWSPKVQFLGDPQYGSPVFSMSKKGIIDIDGGIAYHPNGLRTGRPSGGGYTSWLSEQAGTYYSRVVSPFNTEKHLGDDNLVYPYFMMKESATVLLEGSSLLHICGGSSLFMDGNADVRISGGYSNGGTAFQKGRTYVNIDPGSTFIMSPLYWERSTDTTLMASHSPVFVVTPGANGTLGQIILSAQGNYVDAEQKGSYGNYDFNDLMNTIKNDGVHLMAGFSGSKSMGDTSTHPDRRFLRDKLNISSGNTSPLDHMLSEVEQPTLALQGKTNIIIGDNGVFGARIGAQSGGAVGIDWTTQGNIGIKLGSSYGAIGAYEFVPAGGTVTHFKFGPASNARTAIAIEPNGSFSYKMSPGAVCGISYTPSYSDITFQQDSFEAVFDSDDMFISTDGLTRIELRDEAIIHMKGGEHKIDCGVKAETASDTFEIVTATDYTGMTIEDLSDDDYKDFKIELNKIAGFSSQKRWNIAGGNITSREYYSDRYYIELEGFTETETGSSKYDCFYYWDANRYTYNFSTMYNWPDFQDWLHKRFGPNATVTNGDIEYVYNSIGGGYDMYFSGTINNIQVGINSKTQYPIGTTYGDLSSTDKSKISSVYENRDATTVVTNDVRTDMKYYTDITGFTYTTNSQQGENWKPPIQIRENGPVFQLYDNANICMRNKYVGSSVNFTYMLNSPTETYDFTQSQYEVITQFLNSSDYDTFLNGIEPSMDIYQGIKKELSEIISIAEGDEENPGTKLFITYVIRDKGKENHVIGNEADPIIEMTGGSELRLYNGAKIKAITEWDKTTITFSGAQDEGEVSFTIDELINLKRMASATPTVVVNDNSEMTENDTLYFLNE